VKEERFQNNKKKARRALGKHTRALRSSSVSEAGPRSRSSSPLLSPSSSLSSSSKKKQASCSNSAQRSGTKSTPLRASNDARKREQARRISGGPRPTSTSLTEPGRAKRGHEGPRSPPQRNTRIHNGPRISSQSHTGSPKTASAREQPTQGLGELTQAPSNSTHKPGAAKSAHKCGKS
jgi:hypothetical protein